MQPFDLTTDVVIVGSGGGALCAALVARSRGLDVLVVEKTEFIGGSTAMSGGGIWMPNNPVMRAAGVPDSPAEALKYFDAVVGDVGPASSPARRRAYVENAPRLVAFLQGLGVRFSRGDGYADYYCDAPGGSQRGRTIEAMPFDLHELGPWASKLRPGMTAGIGIVGSTPELTAMLYYNRTVRGVLIGAKVLGRTLLGKLRGQALVGYGGALMGKMLQLAVDCGAQLWTEAPLENLVVDSGAVVGIIVRREGRECRIGARRGVLLAAGGFARSDEMRSRYGGEKAKSGKWSTANPGDTGEVLQTAMALDAATALLDEAVWVPMPRMPDGSVAAYPARRMSSFSRFRWRPGTIMVDAAGRRFANEAMSYMELGQLMFARDREVRAVPSWLVFDDACRRRSLFGVIPGQLPEQWIRDGFIIRADNLAELAAQCGIDDSGLEDTVRRFNDFARTGVDEDFRRGKSAYDRFMGDPGNRPNNCLAPLERAPFYAVAMYPCDVGTCGGLLTDEHARVLRTSGEPIPGLYATGNTSAGVMGRHYLGAGSSIGPTCVFGFVAMEHIAERADAKPIVNQ